MDLRGARPRWSSALSVGGPDSRCLGLDREPGCPPGPDAADDVGDCGAPELLHGGGSEAGLVALFADQLDQEVGTGELGVAVRAGGIEAPLEHVALHEPGTGDEPASSPLAVRANVDQLRPVARALREFEG